MIATVSTGISERSLVQARWLFGLAAFYNISGAASFLFFHPWLEQILHIDPVVGTNLPSFYLACGFVILFGYAYILVARDPVRYRPYIPLAVIGKLMATACFLVPWITGQVPWMLVATIGGDPVYVVLFLLFLRSVPDTGRHGVL